MSNSYYLWGVDYETTFHLHIHLWKSITEKFIQLTAAKLKTEQTAEWIRIVPLLLRASCYLQLQMSFDLETAWLNYMGR